MISIILPVYNGEDHLDRSVASILNQSYQELELLIVNDGSTDSTAALCDKWAAADSRVRVIHQENGGVSAARNAGLDAANGEFIGFVDADDTIDPDTYKTALAAAEDCDIVMWDAMTILQDGSTEPDTIPQLPEGCLLTHRQLTPGLLRWMAGSVWRCLYRSRLLQDIRFPLGIKLSEDRLFNLRAMGKAQSLRYLKKPMYQRVIRPGSAVMRYHPDLWEKNQKAWALAMEIIELCWDASYKPTYTKLFLIDGALAAIRQIAAPTYPGKDQLPQTQAIVRDPLLTEAFTISPASNLWERLLMRKLSRLLLAGLTLRARI